MELLELNGNCLYTPGGAAREYAAVGCNFYRGCPYQCRYCYNRKGITAKVMGVDHAVLDDCFTKEQNRSKKYRHLTGEEYAFLVFKRELEKHVDYFRKTGIFFSFSTDPLCPDAFDLTWQCARYVTKEYGIPVKILTKNADFSAQQMLWFDMVPKERRKLIAFGFTLTGRDDWEPYASKNLERIRLMKVLNEMSFHTFASIEPIIDFEDSLEMIKQTVRFCDQYLIGLMSSRQANGLPPYQEDRCSEFIYYADREMFSAYVNKKTHNLVRIYWKESVRKFMANDAFAMQTINHSPVSVKSNWSLFTNKNIEI